MARHGEQGVAEGWAAGAVVRTERLGTLTGLIDNSTLFTAIPPPNRAQRVVLEHRQVGAPRSRSTPSCRVA
jgi:hypothetical protein